MSLENQESNSYDTDDYQSDNSDEEYAPPDNNLSTQEKLDQVLNSQSIEKAESLLEHIESSNQQEEYTILILRSIISLKRHLFDEAFNYAQEASKIEKGNILPYKIQIYSQRKEKIDKIIETLIQMFRNTKPDLETMILISPKLPKIAKSKDSVVNSYFNAIHLDKQLIPAIQYIPPSKNTLEKRIEILKEYCQDNLEACSMLIQILIKEKGLIDKASDFLQFLPEDHPTRLLYKILFGAHPVETAKILCSQKGNNQHFKNFIKFYEEKNYLALQRFVQNEPFFAAGWLLLADLSNDQASKYFALKKSYEIYEKKEVKQKLEELSGMIIMLDDKGEDAIIFSSPEDQKEFNEVQKIWNQYLETKDKEVLKSILAMKNNFMISKIKTDAIMELKDIIGDDEVVKHLESIKETKYRKVYNILGHFLLEKGNIEEAVKNFVEDANFGSDDPVCLEIASRKLIEDEKIDQALNLCLKALDHEWAIFRAGLIYQRLGKHQEALNMFYKIIRNRPNNNNDKKVKNDSSNDTNNNNNNNNTNDNNNDNDNDDNIINVSRSIDMANIKGESSNFILTDDSISIASVWKVVAQSLAAMNKFMSLKDTLAELRKIGSPDLDYESLYNVFHENNISIDHTYDINTSPLRFHNFLRQVVSNIRMLKWQGRIETCMVLVSKYHDIVVQFIEKWGNLGAILKASGDFFLEGFIASGNQNQSLFAEALNTYKKRAAVDLVPESFVDIANVLHLVGKNEDARTVLKRVLSKYPDSQIIWVNLGVLYAIDSRFPQARHCFIAASQISFDSQNGKVFTYIATVEKALNDLNMMEKAIRRAEEMNMSDASLLQLKSLDGKLNQFDASLCIYEGEIVSRNLPKLCLLRGLPVQALGYALMLNDNNEIANAYEALGKYEQALLFSEDEGQRDRLSKLIGAKDSSIEDENSNEKIDSLINKFKEGNDLISKMTVAALYISKNDKKEAYEILKSLLESSRIKQKENSNKSDNIDNNDQNNNNDNNNNSAKNDANNTNNGNNNDNTNADNDNNANDKNDKNEANMNSSIKIPGRYMKVLLTWMLQIAPPKEKISIKMIETDPLLFFLNLKRSNDEGKAALQMYKKFVSTPYAIKLFVLLYLKNDYQSINPANVISAAESLLTLAPSRESIKILIATEIRMNQYKEAIKSIQQLQILDPNEIPKTAELLQKLISKI